MLEYDNSVGASTTAITLMDPTHDEGSLGDKKLGALTGYAEVTPRARHFAMLSSKIPTNDYGLPRFVYRADLIPTDLDEYSPEDREALLNGASIEIVYFEGYPTMPDAGAMWSQWDFEPADLFTAFKDYLTMSETYGARRLDSLDTTLPREVLQEAMIFFYWRQRAKAHDLFRVAADRKLRESRILTSQDRHYLTAEGLIQKVLSYFNRADEGDGDHWMDELTPKVGMEMLDKLVSIQRRSLGLNSSGSTSPLEAGYPAHAALEVALRTVAKGAEDPNSSGGKGSDATIETLLGDPEAARLAQELIIRVGVPQR